MVALSRHPPSLRLEVPGHCARRRHASASAVEEFWKRLGYAVIQGYGLTETTALVSLNHPFRLSSGSIGKAMPGLEMKLSEDGEILVRGANVAQSYWQGGMLFRFRTPMDGFTPAISANETKPTIFISRAAEKINRHARGTRRLPPGPRGGVPRKDSSVRDRVVVGLERDGNAQPCAVLLLKDSTNKPEAAAIIQRANERLAPFQRMQHWLVRPDADFPRTPTQKPVLKPHSRSRRSSSWANRQSESPQTAPAGALGGLLKGIRAAAPGIK